MQQASPTQSHTRPVHTRQFQSCLAAVIRRKRLSRAVRALFFGVIIDELTDIGWEHMLIVSTKQIKLLAQKQAETGVRPQRLHTGGLTRWLSRSRMSSGCFSSIAAGVLKAEEAVPVDTPLRDLILKQDNIVGFGYYADFTEKLALLSKGVQSDHVPYEDGQAYVCQAKMGLKLAYLGEEPVLGTTGSLEPSTTPALCTTREGRERERERPCVLPGLHWNLAKFPWKFLGSS